MIFGNWKPFQNDKNCFLFHLKSSFCSQDIWIFVVTFWSRSKTAWLEDKVNFNIYNVTAWLTNTILPNISRSKGNQTMKFGQLIYYDMRNIFLKISYSKYGAETSPRPFSEKIKLSVSLDEQSKVLYDMFILYAKLRAIEIHWN